MSDKVYVGRKAKEVKASPAFQEYTKVVIIAGDDEDGNQRVFEAGTDEGNTLEVTNPWGTQQMANDMLARIQGYAYKPLSAGGALLTPAAELGDGITAWSEYSVLASQTVRFDTLHASDFEAPDNGELEHEMPEYASASDRRINRKFSGIRTALKINYDSITAEIADLESDINTELSVMNGTIASKITSTEAQSLISQNINGITLSAVAGENQSTITLRANGVYVDSVVAQFSNIVADSIAANTSITAPTIYGGKYANETGSHWLEIGYDGSNGGRTLQILSTSWGSTPIFAVYDGDYGYTSFSTKGYSFLLTDSYGDNKVTYPSGTWNFSGATVTEMDIDTTAVFG